jgi:hypothetical protein
VTRRFRTASRRVFFEVCPVLRWRVHVGLSLSQHPHEVVVVKWWGLEYLVKGHPPDVTTRLLHAGNPKTIRVDHIGSRPTKGYLETVSGQLRYGDDSVAERLGVQHTVENESNTRVEHSVTRWWGRVTPCSIDHVFESHAVL